MKKFKVAGVPWHVAHQYELAKLPWFGQYDLIINPYRGWGEESRPFPQNARWVTHYEPNYYDFMVAHIDQQSIYDPEKGDLIHKGRLFTEAVKSFKESNPGKPVIVINHMTPFHDKYESPYVIEKIQEATKDCYMIVNSYQAAKQWGWGKPVIHGLDVDEWFDLPKEPRVVTVLSTGGMDKAYRRIFLTETQRFMEEDGVPFVWVGADIKFKTFDEYRNFLGRSLVFFMPAWQSPMPRSRTEAMLSGCCVVTTPYHTWRGENDPTSYITDGVDGFLTSTRQISDPRIMDNPRKTADILKRLIHDEPDLALKVGQKGKELARKLFNKDRFTSQWEQVLKEVGLL